MDFLVAPDGWLTAPDGRRHRCALGRGGVRADKREGDGATPAGRLALRRVLWRPDRVPAPATGLPGRPLGRADGWCDDPDDLRYNHLVRRPCTARHEALWRDDGLYDVLAVLGHNDDPVRRGAGSAIFLHVAAPGYAATAGCVALALTDLLVVLSRCDRATGVVVRAGP